MLGKPHNLVGEKEVGGGRDDYLTAVGGRNADTAGVAGATSCVPNNCLCGRLNIYSSGVMSPASPQAPSTSFYPPLPLVTLAPLAASRS